MSDYRSASQIYDLDEATDQLTRDDVHCDEHDLFKVKNAVGDFVCPACRVIAGQSYKNRKS